MLWFGTLYFCQNDIIKIRLRALLRLRCNDATQPSTGDFLFPSSLHIHSPPVVFSYYYYTGPDDSFRIRFARATFMLMPPPPPPSPPPDCVHIIFTYGKKKLRKDPLRFILFLLLYSLLSSCLVCTPRTHTHRYYRGIVKKIRAP